MEVRVRLAAVGAVEVVLEAAPAEGDIPPLVADPGVSQVDEAAELPIPEEDVGKAEVPVGEENRRNRLL